MTKILSHWTATLKLTFDLFFNMVHFDRIYARYILNEYAGQILELVKVILFTPCFGAIWWIHPGTAWMATWTERETWTLLHAPRLIFLHSIHFLNEIVHLWWLYMLLIGLTMQGELNPDNGYLFARVDPRFAHNVSLALLYEGFTSCYWPGKPAANVFPGKYLIFNSWFSSLLRIDF